MTICVFVIKGELDGNISYCMHFLFGMVFYVELIIIPKLSSNTHIIYCTINLVFLDVACVALNSITRARRNWNVTLCYYGSDVTLWTLESRQGDSMICMMINVLGLSKRT